jgi:glycosyltransferase involved in cell wall biosynthesis
MTPITFVLPGDYRSGGVRVTVLMANLLRERGHSVRIAVPRVPLFGRKALQSLWLKWRQRSNQNAGWLHQFTGSIAPFSKLDDLDYAPGEVVIAVGTYTVAHVEALKKPVYRVRFNHGFPAQPSESDKRAWTGTMPTITVSNTLLPRLRSLIGDSVWGVVPNGIETREYFPDSSVERTGVGACFNPHPNKASEDLLWVLQELNNRRPSTPQHVFSAEAQPEGLTHVNYTRLPPVDEARRIYSRCRVWLLTSRTEGLPGVVLEAMACGCVVVSSANDGSLEILTHEKNALIVPIGDRQGYIAAIERLLNDTPLLTQLAAGAQETIKGFTWSHAADRMQAFLSDVPRLCEQADESRRAHS